MKPQKQRKQQEDRLLKHFNQLERRKQMLLRQKIRRAEAFIDSV
jgi:hypothetical protein